jgi:hypothetical protein
MPTFVLAYRTPKDYAPGSAETMAAWTAWFQSMGAQLQDYGNPVFARQTVGDTRAETVLGGYSLITAGERRATDCACPGAVLG